MLKKEQIVDELIVAIFRLNGRLIEAGNRLVESTGLTSARWQVLGALSLSQTALPVAHIARNMGLSRQAVQRIVDLLAGQGLLRFDTNPHHQRAKLVVLTPQGRTAVNAAGRLQQPWARDMTSKLAREDLATALEVLTRMDTHLAAAAGGDDNPDQ
jgi:DNA-binding MarR family transcriptional regulator